MHELLTAIANMRLDVMAMKSMVVHASSNATELREALYGLEVAIYVMERAAADAYQAA